VVVPEDLEQADGLAQVHAVDAVEVVHLRVRVVLGAQLRRLVAGGLARVEIGKLRHLVSHAAFV
jgi:hypothetical protein